MKTGDAVLVTTQYRGVFFGYLNGKTDSLPDQITLNKARNCVYWTEETRGFLGLTTAGPQTGCRVGPAAETLTLYDVTSISPVSDEAVKAWEAAPWN